MIRLFINPHYMALLEDHGLLAFSQIMSRSAGELIDEDDRRDIQKLRLGENNYYLKRSRSEKASSALESYLTGKLAYSKPYKEMLQITYLREHGFSTAEVVAAGEQLKFGIPSCGFILTREVDGEELSQRHINASPAEKLIIHALLGTLLAQLHSKGFFLSVRLKDIFYMEKGDGSPHWF